MSLDWTDLFGSKKKKGSGAFLRLRSSPGQDLYLPEYVWARLSQLQMLPEHPQSMRAEAKVLAKAYNGRAKVSMLVSNLAASYVVKHNTVTQTYVELIGSITLFSVVPACFLPLSLSLCLTYFILSYPCCLQVHS